MKFLRKSFLLLTVLSVVFLASCSTPLTYPSEIDFSQIQKDYKDSVTFSNDGINIIISPKSDTADGLIFYPGALVSYEAYLPLMAEIASKGIKVILIQMPYDFAIFNTNAALRYTTRYKEIKNWYLCGHSLGGAMAGSYISKHHKHFKGIIFLAAFTTSDISKTSLKALSIYGSLDSVLSQESYTKNKANLPPNYTERIIDGGNHAGYANYGPQKGDTPATISAKQQQSLTAQYIKEFIKS